MGKFREIISEGSSDGFCINQKAKSSAKKVSTGSREPRKGLEDSNEDLETAVRSGNINLPRQVKGLPRHIEV